jgi:hypothetical protein
VIGYYSVYPDTAFGVLAFLTKDDVARLVDFSTPDVSPSELIFATLPAHCRPDKLSGPLLCRVGYETLRIIIPATSQLGYAIPRVDTVDDYRARGCES